VPKWCATLTEMLASPAEPGPATGCESWENGAVTLPPTASGLWCHSRTPHSALVRRCTCPRDNAPGQLAVCRAALQGPALASNSGFSVCCNVARDCKAALLSISQNKVAAGVSMYSRYARGSAPVAICSCCPSRCKGLASRALLYAGFRSLDGRWMAPRHVT
jgi:hypothetical protein